MLQEGLRNALVWFAGARVSKVVDVARGGEWTHSRVCKYTAQVGCQKRHYNRVEDDELHACNNTIASSARTKEDDFPCIAVEGRKGRWR